MPFPGEGGEGRDSSSLLPARGELGLRLRVEGGGLRVEGSGLRVEG